MTDEQFDALTNMVLGLIGEGVQASEGYTGREQFEENAKAIVERARKVVVFHASDIVQTGEPM